MPRVLHLPRPLQGRARVAQPRLRPPVAPEHHGLLPRVETEPVRHASRLQRVAPRGRAGAEAERPRELAALLTPWAVVHLRLLAAVVVLRRPQEQLHACRRRRRRRPPRAVRRRRCRPAPGPRRPPVPGLESGPRPRREPRARCCRGAALVLALLPPVPRPRRRLGERRKRLGEQRKGLGPVSPRRRRRGRESGVRSGHRVAHGPVPARRRAGLRSGRGRRGMGGESPRPEASIRGRRATGRRRPGARSMRRGLSGARRPPHPAPRARGSWPCAVVPHLSRGPPQGTPQALAAEDPRPTRPSGRGRGPRLDRRSRSLGASARLRPLREERVEVGFSAGRPSPPQ